MAAAARRWPSGREERLGLATASHGAMWGSASFTHVSLSRSSGFGNRWQVWQYRTADSLPSSTSDPAGPAATLFRAHDQVTLAKRKVAVRRRKARGTACIICAAHL